MGNADDGIKWVAIAMAVIFGLAFVSIGIEAYADGLVEVARIEAGCPTTEPTP